MEEYTREQIQRADDTDLYVFLSGRGEQFKRCGKEYRWLRHDSVMINKNEWYRFSQNKGGHAIDFMKEFYGLSFAEAVKELLGEEGVGETNYSGSVVKTQIQSFYNELIYIVDKGEGYFPTRLHNQSTVLDSRRTLEFGC